MRPWFHLVLAGAGFALLGCGLPKAPAFPDGASAEEFEQASTGGMEGLPQDEPQPLRLHPGDVVTVTTIGEESQEITGLVVDETGDVHLPLGGDVKVGGLTLSDAEKRLEDSLREYVKFVRVTVKLTDPAGHQASVLGAVKNAGRFQIQPGMRLTDLLAAAGGALTQVPESGQAGEVRFLADLGGARLHRDGETLPVSLPRALEGDARHDVRIRPGDRLYVPPKMLEHVVVLGAVNQASTFTHRRGMRLTEALALAGGSTIEADRGDIRVVRGGMTDPRVYTADLHNIVDGDSHDVVLQSGDVVFVTDHWIADVGEVLDRLGPLLSTGVTVGLTTAVLLTR